MAHVAAELSELQNGASAISDLVARWSFASCADGRCQRASRERSAGRRGELYRCDLRHGQGWRRGDRSDQAWKRLENHGDCGSARLAALGEHTRREPSRSALGAALLRLLHDRNQAGQSSIAPMTAIQWMRSYGKAAST